MSKILKFPSPAPDRNPEPPAIALRNRRVEEYLYVVEPIARGIHGNRPPSFELDDLISIGYVALVEAADDFDGARNVPFEAFAKFKVRKAILEKTRRKEYREATHNEIEHWHSEMKDERTEVFEHINQQQERKQMRAAVLSIGDVHRRVIVSKYRYGKTLGDIGRCEGVTYSHGVTQLHRDALQAARCAFESRGLRRSA